MKAATGVCNKVSGYYISNYKVKLLNILAKFLKNILQLLKVLQFDICFVIKIRVGLEIAEITRLLNYFRSYSFAL